MYDTILLPTDGSTGAARGTEHAIELAARYGAALHVLYVVDEDLHGTTPALSSGELGLEKWDERGRDLAREIEQRAASADVETVTACVRGSPEREIKRYAERNDVDLIVMGLHGTAEGKGPHSGSTTERVTRSVPVAVLHV